MNASPGMTRARMHTLARRIGAGVAAAVALALSPAVAHAHFSSSSYTYNNCDAGRRLVDPINFVFYGARANSTLSAHHIEHHAFWDNTSGSFQAFFTEGNCRGMATQRASSGNASSRFHIRLFPTDHPDRKGRLETVGDAHHEDLVWNSNKGYPCHAVDKNGRQGSGFDQGRSKLVNQFRGKHTFGDYAAWGNTRNFKQCDGDYAGSDGNVAWFLID